MPRLRMTNPNRKLLWPTKNKIACLPIVCLLLAACNSNTVYHSYQSIPTMGWSKGDTLVYTLPTSIPTGTYKMTIGIRHQENYPYRDLWLGISQSAKARTPIPLIRCNCSLPTKRETGTETAPADCINSPGSILLLLQSPKTVLPEVSVSFIS